MNSIEVSLIAFACIFGAAIVGMLLQSHLPEHHQSPESQRIVNLGAGIIGTMAALVLGLLVASAKGTYDAQSNEVTAVAAKMVLVDRGLSIYGPEANDARDQLRSAVTVMIDRLWPQERLHQADPSHTPPVTAAALYESIQRLSPQNDTQRAIKAQVSSILADVAQTRWLMFEQGMMSVSRPLLVILVFWMAINFFSFGLFAPRNATVITTLFLCALAVGGAIFLILELYRPFGGFIQIPSTALHTALEQMSK